MIALSKAGELTFESDDSELGLYLTSANVYYPDLSENYTTLCEYNGVIYSSSDYSAYNYGDKTCASSAYGVSGLPIVNGEIYLLIVDCY